jgi:hypothetical protein
MSITLTIIKPDAVASGKAGKILAHLEEKGFRIRAIRMMHLTDKQAGAFYEVHRERPFYGSLVSFMTECDSCVRLGRERGPGGRIFLCRGGSPVGGSSGGWEERGSEERRLRRERPGARIGRRSSALPLRRSPSPPGSGA